MKVFRPLVQFLQLLRSQLIDYIRSCGFPNMIQTLIGLNVHKIWNFLLPQTSAEVYHLRIDHVAYFPLSSGAAPDPMKVLDFGGTDVPVIHRRAVAKEDW